MKIPSNWMRSKLAGSTRCPRAAAPAFPIEIRANCLQAEPPSTQAVQGSIARIGFGGTVHGQRLAPCAPEKALTPEIDRPGQPCQRGVDALVGWPAPGPAVDAGIRQPDHHERKESGGRDS